MRSLCTLLLVCLSMIADAQDKKYTFVFLNSNPAAPKISEEESKKLMEGHMKNMESLAKAGRLLAAGPFEGGGGIFVLNTLSPEEADQWMQADPGIQAKRWTLEKYIYTPRQGGVCPVSAPYEMIMYSFVRFDAIVSKSTAPTYPQILKKHDDYLKGLGSTGNVVTEGVFGDGDAGILIMKGDVVPAVFEGDPGVQEGLLDMSIRKLYIAKGSFCEK